MELTLMEKTKWCHDQAERLYKSADKNATHMQGALGFFKLERGYLNDIRWYRFTKELLENITCDCEDEDGCQASAQLSLLLNQLGAAK